MRAFLGLGGNIGDPAKAMGQALGALDADPEIAVVAVSSLYRTPPWGKTDQPDFLNAVAELRTVLPPSDLLEKCIAAERALKRERIERWGPRTIDLDILLYGDQAIAEPGLVVPHPRMTERAFVLVPLAEIDDAVIVAGGTVADHLAALDATGITRLDSGRDWWRK